MHRATENANEEIGAHHGEVLSHLTKRKITCLFDAEKLGKNGIEAGHVEEARERGGVESRSVG